MYRWKILIKKMVKYIEIYLKGLVWWSYGYNVEKFVVLDVMLFFVYLEGNFGFIRNRVFILFREIFII